MPGFKLAASEHRLPASGVGRWPDGTRPDSTEFAWGLAEFLGQVDTFRHADTTVRNLTENEFLRGKGRLRRAVRHAEDAANPETRSNWLDLLVLR